MSEGRAGGALRWIALAAALLAFVIVPFVLFGEAVEGWLQRQLDAPPGGAAVAAVVIGGLSADVLLPIPSSVLATASGSLLGLAGGTAANFAGLSIGAAIGYAIGAAGRGLAERVVGRERLKGVDRIMRRRGDVMVAAMRPIPVLAEVSVVVAGAAAMPIRRFAVYAGLSNLGVAAAYALIGDWAVAANELALAAVGALLLPGLAMVAGAALRPGADAAASEADAP